MLIILLLVLIFGLACYIIFSPNYFKKLGFELKYGIKSLFSTPKKMDDFNAESVKNSKRTGKEITIIIHGAAARYYTDVYGAAVWYKEKGLNPVSFDYNFKALPDDSAQKLGRYIDEILQQTNTKKVNIIGICSGGMLAKYYAEKFDGAKKINKLITVVSPAKIIPENSFVYRFDKMFIFNPEPYNKVLEITQNKNPVEKHLYIYSKNDFLISEKYQTSESGNYVGLYLGHSPFTNVNPDMLNAALDFINKN